MNLNNLHSLFNRPWYIDQSYASAYVQLISAFFQSNIKADVTPIAFKLYDKRLGDGSLQDDNSKEEKSVLILSIKSPIVKYDQFCGPRGTKTMIETLETVLKNDNISGIVLDIDSGGGQAYGTPEFYDFIKTYPKPVVAYTDGLMCSAAYYIGSASQHIIANKRAEAIGSIGAYTQIVDLTGKYEKEGATVHTIYASKSTDKNKAYNEALKGDYKLYVKEVLDPLVDQFITDIKDSRLNINETVFKGATYNAKASLKYGLIDEIGTLQTAINKVFELANNANTNSNTNNSKNKTMSKLNVPFIETVIGSSFSEGETENGIILTDEQAKALENRLSENDTALAKAKTETGNLSKTITTLEANARQTTTAIQNALKTAEVDGAEKMTNEAGVKALSALVEEYGARDGAEFTSNSKSTDSTIFESAVDKKLQSILIHI